MITKNTVSDKIYDFLVKMFDSPQRNQLANQIAAESGLDIRTVFGLSDIINNNGCADEGIDGLIFEMIDPDFYTFEKVVELAAMGLEGLIPTSFYEDEEFLKETKIHSLPNNFAKGNANLVNFHVCDEITRIGAHAFDGAVNLRKVDFPENCNISFGKAAFKDCINLTKFILESGKVNVSDEMFKDCINLEIFKASVVGDIGKSAFSGCLKLQTVSASLESYNETIKESAFDNCSILGTIEIDHLKVIGKNAFRDCFALTHVALDEVVSLGEGAFRNSGLKHIELSKDLCEIPDNCFCSCVDLEQIFFYEGYGIDTIGKDAFFGCSGLKLITGMMYDHEFYKTDGIEELTQNITVDQESDHLSLTCDVEFKKHLDKDLMVLVIGGKNREE